MNISITLYNGLSPNVINATAKQLTLSELKSIPPHLHVGYMFSNESDFSSFLPKNYMKLESNERCAHKIVAGLFAKEKLKEVLQKENKVPSNQSQINQWIEEIENNVVFDAGFRINPDDMLSTTFCYCPCSRKFRRIHNICCKGDATYNLLENLLVCKEIYTPRGLLKHLKDNINECVFSQAYILLSTPALQKMVEQ